jgi:predicted AlkP superfamily phosphohydrolase/phosphomutase
LKHPIVAALCWVSCLVLIACPRSTKVEEPVPRVLIVGIDGATSRVMDAMFANHRLKNLRSIAERGVYGPIKSEAPALSPRVWTTVATGKVPAKHGVFGWVKPTDDETMELFYSSDRVGYALWNILSDAGKKVAVVNWLITYPPERINGILISDHALSAQIREKKDLAQILVRTQGKELDSVKAAHNSAAAIFPESWQENALAPSHATVVLTDVASPFADSAIDDGFGEHHETLQRFLDIDQRLASIALEIIDETKPDVTMVLLQGIDRVSHYLFGCLESPVVYPPTFQPTTEQRLACQAALYDYYEFTDQLIGRMLTRFDDDDLIIVVSDHGFEARFKEPLTGGHDSEWTSYGICVARGPRVHRHGLVYGTTAADITPTVLTWYGLPLAKDMDGRPAGFLEPTTAPVPEAIETYDTKPVERLAEGESGGESDIKERLRNLGYLD